MLAGRVRGQVLGHVAGVARVFAGQQLLGPVHPLLLLGPETDATGVIDEAVRQVQVAPARPLGALAPVVFLAVTAAEGLLVEEPHRIQAIPRQVHAAAHPGGHGNHVPGTELAGEAGVELGHRQAEQQGVVTAKIGETENGGIVGKGCDAGHTLMLVGRLAQAPQPVVGHLHIAVQQQHVPLQVVLHTAVDRGHEAEVLLIFQQHQVVVGGSQLAQVSGNRGVGGAVIEHHHPGPGRVDGGQHRRQAAPGFLQPLIDRDDDVNLAHAFFSTA